MSATDVRLVRHAEGYYRVDIVGAEGHGLDLILVRRETRVRTARGLSRTYSWHLLDVDGVGNEPTRIEELAGSFPARHFATAAVLRHLRFEAERRETAAR